MIKISVDTDKKIKDIFSAVKIHHISKYSCEIGDKVEFWRGDITKANTKPHRFGKGKIVNCVPIYINPYSESVTIDNEEYSDSYFLNLIARNEGYSFWDTMKEKYQKPVSAYLLFWNTKAKFSMELAKELFHEQPFDIKDIKGI